MKLRILGDTLRLRLSQSDVKTFQSSGKVVDTIHFGGGELSYSLELDPDADAPYARLEGSVIRVALPRSVARNWAESDEIGIEATQSLPGARSLVLLIEKDFKCAVPRAGEETYDGFPHPDGHC